MKDRFRNINEPFVLCPDSGKKMDRLTESGYYCNGDCSCEKWDQEFLKKHPTRSDQIMELYNMASIDLKRVDPELFDILTKESENGKR